MSCWTIILHLLGPAVYIFQVELSLGISMFSRHFQTSIYSMRLLLFLIEENTRTVLIATFSPKEVTIRWLLFGRVHAFGLFSYFQALIKGIVQVHNRYSGVCVVFLHEDKSRFEWNISIILRQSSGLCQYKCPKIILPGPFYSCVSRGNPVLTVWGYP